MYGVYNVNINNVSVGSSILKSTHTIQRQMSSHVMVITDHSYHFNFNFDFNLLLNEILDVDIETF